MYPDEDEEKSAEEKRWEKEREAENARVAKLLEEQFDGYRKSIRTAEDEPPAIEFPKVWREIWPESVFKDLEDRRDRYRRGVAEGKDLLKEFEGIKDKVGPAIARAEKLKKQAEEAQREAEELEGRADSLPIRIKVQAESIEQYLRAVTSWKDGVQNALQQLRRQ